MNDSCGFCSSFLVCRSIIAWSACHMRRFFFEPSTRRGDKVFLSEEESSHLVRVLRLKKDQEIELIDGIGGLYRAVIMDLGKTVTARIVEERVMREVGKKSLWVGQGLLKGKKMDTTIQHCTELGVARLTPFVSSRCQGRLDEMQGRKKSDRWERIVVSSCKQCRRTQQMHVDEVVDFTGMLALANREPDILRLVFWEEETDVHLQEIMAADQSNAKVCILLGPEGGFSRAEMAAARDLGWQTVSLGNRILRAETATLTAVSLVQFLIGNL
ncbi:MAG: 16S rRNA (uracil(1498)-N(3))-methyltransferase [Desulfobulbaceae bacterium]|nr:MAG: 16S rRNA (uracil(1498)-N(3))-methyltransferase [Desulfobulbaceae bacterium]